MRFRMLMDDYVHVKHYVVRGLALESCVVVPSLTGLPCRKHGMAGFRWASMFMP
jgi:hypothetical protein